LRHIRKNLQEKGESHEVLSPFDYRTAVIFQALIPTLNAFQTYMDMGICVADNAISTISSMRWCLLFSFHKCWSNTSSLIAVSDSPSGNVSKKWSSSEVVKGFKVKDRFPSKSVQRSSIGKSVQRNSTRDF
jgi:hypothetical protein